MEYHPYLTFTLHESLYGINTFVVEEIFFLPELTVIPESPFDIVGVVNLRGEILPIMDLNLRFGYHSDDYKLTDSVIVLKVDNFRVGIIVNQVHEVRNLTDQNITSEMGYGRENYQVKKNYFINGIAKDDNDIIFLLDLEKLVSYVEQEISADSLNEKVIEDRLLVDSINGDKLSRKRVFCPNATPEEKEVFHTRAESLRLSVDSEDLTGLKPLAVIMLNEEYFAIDLNIVQEFTDIKKVTPIPCCPNHILGNMNLRGEILTLIDIRELLNLNLAGITENAKAIVVNMEGIVAGLIVKQVCDVMFLNPADITSVPTAIHSINDEYLQGATNYNNGKMMSILNLPKIFLKGGLMVDEAV
jgi:purine-binding chemotaxis protein CheW